MPAGADRGFNRPAPFVRAGGYPATTTVLTMTGPFGGVAAHTVSRSTRSTLGGLMTSVGEPGLRAAAVLPGLLAAVDQHAAAVRDSLGGDARPLTAMALAGYAEGVRDAAHEHGWRAPDSGAVDWSTADWVLTRLLAVSSLVRSLPTAG